MSDFRLPEIALVTGKKERTIRRWCALGFVPGAYQTRGKHWRVRTHDLVATVREARRRVAGFARRPKGFADSAADVARRTRAMVRAALPRQPRAWSPTTPRLRTLCRIVAFGLSAENIEGEGAETKAPKFVRGLRGKRAFNDAVVAALVVAVRATGRTRRGVAAAVGVSPRTLNRHVGAGLWERAVGSLQTADVVAAVPATTRFFEGGRPVPTTTISAGAAAREAPTDAVARRVVDALKELDAEGHPDDDAHLAAAMNFRTVADFHAAVPRAAVERAVVYFESQREENEREDAPMTPRKAA